MLLAAAANLLLGGYTRAVLNMVSIVRNIVVLKEKYRMLRNYVGAVFDVATFISTIVGYVRIKSS